MTGMTETGSSYLLAALCAAGLVVLVPVLTVCVCILDRVLLARTRSRFGAGPATGGDALATAIASLRQLASLEPLSPGADCLRRWAGPFASLFLAIMGLAAITLWVPLGGTEPNPGIVLALAAIACSGFASLASTWADPRMSPPRILRGLLQFAAFGAAAILGLSSALLFSGSLSMPEIAKAQWDQGTWFILVVPIGFAIYLFASVAAIRGAALAEPPPAGAAGAKDRARAGLSALLLLTAEAANIFAISGVAAVVFLGGTQRPLARYHDHLLGTSIELLDALPPVPLLLAGAAFLGSALRRRGHVSDERIPQGASLVPCGIAFAAAIVMASAPIFGRQAFAAVNGAFWFTAKVLACVAAFLWLRIAVASIRFEQWMKLVWHFLVPLAIANLISAAISIVLRQNLGWTPVWSVLFTTAMTLAFGLQIISWGEATHLDRLPAGSRDAAE